MFVADPHRAVKLTDNSLPKVVNDKVLDVCANEALPLLVVIVAVTVPAVPAVVTTISTITLYSPAPPVGVVIAVVVEIEAVLAVKDTKLSLSFISQFVTVPAIDTKGKLVTGVDQFDVFKEVIVVFEPA